MGKMWMRCVMVVALASCGGGDGGDVDAGVRDGSAGIDAPVDAGVRDGSAGIDAPVATCSEALISGSCFYAGYGTMCSVPCSLPETCSFNVGIAWTGNYCCVGLEQWVDCRCVDGTARCARSHGSSDRVTPTTTCEFCAQPDAGG